MRQENNFYHLYHECNHVEGHTVKIPLTGRRIYALNEDEAIEQFKQQKPSIGKYIKKDRSGNWRYANSGKVCAEIE